jgi:hypothetical protein
VPHDDRTPPGHVSAWHELRETELPDAAELLKLVGLDHRPQHLIEGIGANFDQVVYRVPDALRLPDDRRSGWRIHCGRLGRRSAVPQQGPMTAKLCVLATTTRAAIDRGKQP